MSSETDRRQFIKGSAVIAAGSVLASATPTLFARDSIAFKEYRQYDALGLAKLVRKGDASPTELLDIAISRANAIDPKINAITVRHFELAHQAIKHGLPDGPFSGVPYLLKDLGVALNGTITTGGSVFFKDARYDYDSTLVARYKQAGLVLFGKTHSPEFGGTATTETQLFGATRNPWNLALSAGGSSGGSAAAVVAGIVPAAHASDGGGSIRIPASACGLFGMKPSRGRVPMGPKVYETRDGCSAMHAVSRSVRDSAALLDISAGAEIGDAYASPALPRSYSKEIRRAPGKLRIALMTQPLLPLPVESDCVIAAEQAAALCESLGHNVEEASPVLDAMALWDAFGTTSTVLTAQKVAAREATLGRVAKPEELEKLTWHSLEAGNKVSGVKYSQARATLHAASRVLGRFMQDYDVILSPTMAMVPPKIGVLSLSQPYESFMIAASKASVFTALYNMTGQPAMSVPLHWTDDNVPVGVMFAGRFGDEATLFRLAAQLEEAAPWFDRLPAV